MAAIAFLITDACGGLAHCHGLIRDEGETLVVEYQTQDGIAGLIKSDIQEARIPVSEIGSIAMETTWFGQSTKLVIQLSSMKLVNGIPGMTRGKLKFPIAKGDRAAAEALVQTVSAYLNKSGPGQRPHAYST